MPLRDLTSTEISVVGRALQKISEGDILASWEFGARIAVELDEFRKLLGSWPNWDDTKVIRLNVWQSTIRSMIWFTEWAYRIKTAANGFKLIGPSYYESIENRLPHEVGTRQA